VNTQERVIYDDGYYSTVPDEWRECSNGLWVTRGIQKHEHAAINNAQRLIKDNEVKELFWHLVSTVIYPKDILHAVNRADAVKWPSVIEFLREFRDYIKGEDEITGSSANVVGLDQFGKFIGIELDVEIDNERDYYSEWLSDMLETEIILVPNIPHINIAEGNLADLSNKPRIERSLPEVVHFGPGRVSLKGPNQIRH